MSGGPFPVQESNYRFDDNGREATVLPHWQIENKQDKSSSRKHWSSETKLFGSFNERDNKGKRKNMWQRKQLLDDAEDEEMEEKKENLNKFGSDEAKGAQGGVTSETAAAAAAAAASNERKKCREPETQMEITTVFSLYGSQSYKEIFWVMIFQLLGWRVRRLRCTKEKLRYEKTSFSKLCCWL